MFCSKCGFKLESDAMFCDSCGEAQEQQKSEQAQEATVPASEKPAKNNKLEFFIVVMLGITALLTALASYNGAEYASRQAENYIESNLQASNRNTAHNEAMTALLNILAQFNEINSVGVDLEYARENNNLYEINRLEYKMNGLIKLLDGNIASSGFSENPLSFVEWSEEEIEKFFDSFYDESERFADIANAHLKQGIFDSTISSRYGIVTVIYAVTLFMLGIVSPLKSGKNKRVVVGISMVTFSIATLYMLGLWLLY